MIILGKHRIFSPEHRARISAANKGRIVSAETRAKLSAAGKGRRPHNWNGGKSKTSDGRIIVYLQDHPHAMPNGYVFEHRLVMERVLGRYLRSDEIVHHVDGDPANNNPENLRVMSQGEHVAEHRTGVPRSEETRRRLSETRRRKFAAGLLQVHNKGKRRTSAGYVERVD